jgi:glycine hydroxymethyltransferase
VALEEAMQPEFKTYAKQVMTNAQVLAEELLARGFELVTGGTDSHLLLLDMTSKSISGKDAEKALGKAGITVNKNTIPFDPRSPFDPSGVRLGTPALTTRGMKEAEMKQIAGWIDQAVKSAGDDQVLAQLHATITDFAQAFPLPS